ncbi:MAG: RimK family alpha-L-glutamate ligase [Methylophilales bacterium]|nr:RimK family alpha-L-glutamate ligase [Methylophilales bacterium]
MRVPIFTDDAGWHGEQLKQAFAERGVEVIFVSLQSCSLDLSGTQAVVEIPGFEYGQLPKAVFVRGVAGGTLQQVITRLNILHILSMLGVRIYNDVKAIERTVDKAMTSFLLHHHGVSTPATWVCESRTQLAQIRLKSEKNKQQLVLKPLFGSQGKGVRKLLADDAMPVPMQQFVEGVYYLQHFIQSTEAPHDYRVFVIAGQVVATMKRVGHDWVNNVAAGARCEAIEPNAILNQVALQAANALAIDYCGVDVIQAVGGEYLVLEVNSIPAWKGLQSVTDVNVAKLLVNDFLSKVNAN